MGFVHLHLHSEYSLLDGVTKVSELFDYVKSLGQDAVAITEHGNMGAVIKKYKAAKKAGVKLIFGCEIYVCDDIGIKNKDEKRYHLVLLAKDLEGYQNLVRLVSIANNEGFYYRARLDRNLLRKYSKGLICMTACLGNDIAQAVVGGREDRARRLIEEYIDIFGKENFYLEVENHGIPKEEKVADFYRKIGGEMGIKIVATCDAHFLREEDAYAHEVMLAIQTNGNMNEENRFRFDGSGYWVKSEDEMKVLFPDNQEYLDVTCEIADRCNVELDIGEPIFPDFEAPEGLSHKEYLYKLCKEGVDRIYDGKENYDEAIERMNFELDVIGKMGFEAYFLIVADFITEAKKYCQVGPGRGSGAGSIVAYSLGITQLDPLELGLLFERFLNPDRISLPDFDVDFGDKDIVLDYVRKKYGKEKVSLIGTFGTMSAKAVLKDVMRVFRIPFSEANVITKLVNEKTIQRSLDAERDGHLVDDAQRLREFEEKFPKIFEIAKRLEGCVRHKGVHACGVVWGKKGISEYVPTYGKNGDVITQIEGPDVESYGLVKFDFLGLETLNVIKKVLDAIGKDSGWLENIPMDDDSVYKMLRDQKSIGVFQVESEGMRKTLSLVKPTCFDDIIAIVALYRPGPMQYLDIYANRKHGREVVDYPHANAEKILAPTYGIMVYQEQVMQLSRALANFSAGDSDVLRKAIGKKKIDLMNKMEKQFKDGCIGFSGMESGEVNKLWDDIVKFAAYSFNKSHAAAYALISYRTAYLKKYYPVEFYAATISSAVRNPEKLAFYLESARQEGISILHPDINSSTEDFSVEELEGSRLGRESGVGSRESGVVDGGLVIDVKGLEGGENVTKKVIRVGLGGIKNVGCEAMIRIIERRPYKSYQDFINKVDLSKVNKRVCHSLISVGCFDELGINRASLLSVYDRVSKNENLCEKQLTLFGGVANVVEYPDLPPMRLKDMLDLEQELLGVCVSGHAIDAYAESKNNEFTRFDRLKDDMEAEVFGLVKRFTKIMTKNGDDMAFMDLSSKSGELKVTIFPRDFKECVGEGEIRVGDGVKVSGKFKESEEFGDAFIAKSVLVCEARG
ncbi:DNA polymerase III subunit alpha [Candidatus Pacearchaeota archaeon]|nr:DNA polymerase III subunit alpha [Candidatus Pacearchaeota archaeon]